MSTLEIIFFVVAFLMVMSPVAIWFGLQKLNKGGIVPQSSKPIEARFKPDGITDNRMEWAEKVLRESVPEGEMFLAKEIMLWRASGREGALKNGIRSCIQPRLIAGNWNKNTGE